MKTPSKIIPYHLGRFLSGVKDKLKSYPAAVEDLVRTADGFNQSLIPSSEGLKAT